MSKLAILRYPDPRLYTRATPVQVFDQNLRQLVKDMAETMYSAPGIGLAATQVNVHQRLLIIDLSETHDSLQVFINPEIIQRDGQQQLEEGCLSVPGIYDFVQRAAQIRVRAQDLEGQWFEQQADGLLAVCIQHEIDHLDGKVFVDYLSRLKRDRIKTKLNKRLRDHD
jgi:peptide deformylase